MNLRGALSACAFALLAGQASGQAGRGPWLAPQDAQDALAQSDAYAWKLFIALNWPADARARGADPTATFGVDRPVVWETWQNAAEVYRADGGDPGPWTLGTPRPAVADEERFETASLKDLPNLRHVAQGRMAPFDDPVAAARRLTEIRMNRAAFEYIRARALYNVEGQLHAAAAGGVAFPADAIEVKAQWRPVTAQERGRYHTLEVRLADGQRRLYGLTALHIISKTLPQWFWATFEHVDNATLADAEGWQLPSRDRLACPPQRPDCNRAPAGIGLEGTVWQFYRLRGTMTGFLEDDGQPARLANSALEKGMQASSSCITCHARASIGLAGDTPVRLPVFESVAPRAAGGFERRGYVGLPDAAWFEKAAAGARFWPLDSVWSLSLAKPKRGS